MLIIGEQAPNFTLPNQDNIPISLYDFANHWVVVYFYPKDDTAGCTTEACAFRDSISELTGAGIVVLGISKDSVESHKKFHQRYNLNFNLLADTNKTVITQYGAWQEKMNFGKRYMGIQRMTYIIAPGGTVAHIFPKVTPRGHEREVIAFVNNYGGAI
jgi:thioredoxin-dependent peroxiredoxin